MIIVGASHRRSSLTSVAWEDDYKFLYAMICPSPVISFCTAI